MHNLILTRKVSSIASPPHSPAQQLAVPILFIQQNMAASR